VTKLRRFDREDGSF